MKGVSVIICCFNSARRLSLTLQCLQEQKVHDSILWEIILVDNASSDETVSIANSNWKQNNPANLKIISEPNPGLVHARLAGVNNAQFEFLTFIDDDNRVNANWIQTVFDIFTMHPEIACCGGQAIPEFEEVKPAWFDHYATSFAAGKQFEKNGVLEKGQCLWGAGISLRRDAWDALSQTGVENILSGRSGIQLSAGEDSELSLKLQLLGFRLWYDDKLVLRHFMPKERLDLKKLIMLFIGFGKSEVVLRMYRSMLDPSIRIHHPWWKELIAGIYYYFKLALFYRSKLDQIPFGWTTKSAFIRGYLSELGRLKSRYDQIYSAQLQVQNYTIR